MNIKYITININKPIKIKFPLGVQTLKKVLMQKPQVLTGR